METETIDIARKKLLVAIGALVEAYEDVIESPIGVHVSFSRPVRFYQRRPTMPKPLSFEEYGWNGEEFIKRGGRK